MDSTRSLDKDLPLTDVFAAAAPGARVELDRSWWGFGGAHGGLSLALLTQAMRARSAGRQLQRVTGQFRRSLRGPFTLAVSEPTVGKTIAWLTSEAIDNGQVGLSADALFTTAMDAHTPPVAPPMPDVPAPDECPAFIVPPDFVAFARRVELRMAGPHRPYAGGREPRLTAWARLTASEAPIDDLGLIVLMDSLPPSYAVILQTLTPIPTVTFSLTFNPGLAQARSPWVLLDAQTTSASADGWVVEKIDAWHPGGQHLGSAEQFRMVVR